MTGLVVAVVAWWLLIGAAVALTLPAPASSATATPTPFGVAAGRDARLHQPGMPSWPIPVERAAFDDARRGFQESDEDLIERAFATSEWLDASHGQAVTIVAVDGDAVQVELLEGTFRGRRAWLLPRHLGPLP
jgi:hypothetical protein